MVVLLAPQFCDLTVLVIMLSRSSFIVTQVMFGDWLMLMSSHYSMCVYNVKLAWFVFHTIFYDLMVSGIHSEQSTVIMKVKDAFLHRSSVITIDILL